MTHLGLVSCAALMVAAAPAAAQSEQTVRRYSIPAGPLDEALHAFGVQSGEQLLYPPALTVGRRTEGVTGDHTAETALRRLLGRTGLAFRRTRPNTWIVYDPSTRAEAPEPEAVEIDEVLVTGSLLRGVVDGPSPVVVIGRDQIDREGRASVAETLAALPQNFGGSANEADIGNGGDRTGTNANYANGVNLRGLGSDATLVLVNGRRIAGTGSKGDFADVSSIPTAAVERIDVLLDGASALYGADAVGGVVNIVLRDDYDGAETRARYGSASDGAFSDVQFAQTLGRSWTGGNVMAVYEYQDRDALPASERPRAGNSDLRPFGGSDQRLNYSNPGNIMVFDPVSGGYVAAFAIPSGQDGTALRPSDFLAGQENRTSQRSGLNVLPRQTRHIAYLAGRQDIGGRLTLSGDARWARREFETRSTPITTLLTVNRGNPYFVSPTGAASHMIGYSFAGQMVVYRLTTDRWSLGVLSLETGAVRWTDLSPEESQFGRTVAWRSADELLGIFRPDHSLPIAFRIGNQAQDRVRALWEATESGRRVGGTWIPSGARRDLRSQPPPLQLRSLNLATGEDRLLAEGAIYDFMLSPDRSRLVVMEEREDLQPEPGVAIRVGDPNRAGREVRFRGPRQMTQSDAADETP